MFARACEEKSIRWHNKFISIHHEIDIYYRQASSVLTANWSTLSMRILGEKKEIKSALIHLLLWVDTTILNVWSQM